MHRTPSLFAPAFLSAVFLLLVSAAPVLALPIGPAEGEGAETALELAGSAGPGAGLASQVSVASAAAGAHEQPGAGVARQFQRGLRWGLGMPRHHAAAAAAPAVPEPALGLLLATGLWALAARRTRK